MLVGRVRMVVCHCERTTPLLVIRYKYTLVDGITAFELVITDSGNEEKCIERLCE